MSEVKQANQGTVTSIAGTDLVMCHVGGSYHPISFDNLMKAVRGGIQIGGRNLIKNSAEITIPKSANLSNFKFLPLTIGVKKGDKITISCETIEILEGSNCSTFSALIRKDAAHNWDGLGAEGSLSVQNKKVTLTVNQDYDNPHLLLYSGPDSNSSNRSVKFFNVKVERGNIASDWTPAPEDIASGLWGGVIGYLPITYSMAEKGGAHECQHQDSQTGVVLVVSPRGIHDSDCSHSVSRGTDGTWQCTEHRRRSSTRNIHYAFIYQRDIPTRNLQLWQTNCFAQKSRNSLSDRYRGSRRDGIPNLLQRELERLANAVLVELAYGKEVAV